MENMENNTQFMSEIDILCSITLEYNMFWRDFMIKQCPRGDINQIEYKKSEIMPTMMVFNKRNPEIYKESRCVRCKFTHENWTHIWICKENDTTINQIINFAFERLKEKLDNVDFRFGFNYHAKLLQILNERFLYL
ncbi:hypothetical protein RhiirA4_469558 [Rhizophagus irregularis]|uniref:Uncharacterized protein n=1 Tax=Rhizophagus irregularis TaxID=588596 RepID=A0A2I1GZR2_9GLOM|nr:hypothetical protein RhiirA4_469558 [Rhizophagus irregularis]